MPKSIFTHKSYKTFLTEMLSERGMKKALCDFIPCQTTFFSNLMTGKNNLSLEHGMRACEFLNLNSIESHYFMLLLQFEKAGSKKLEDYFKKQISDIQNEQNKIVAKIATHEKVALEDQMQFYNSWLYVTVHILSAIPKYQTRQAIRNYLKISALTIDPIIDFMLKCGMLNEENGKLSPGQKRTHVAKGSPFLMKHHTNWRMRAIQSLDFEHSVEHANDLHYSMVMSLSESDIEKMKEIIYEAITRTDSLLKNTGDEVAYSFCMDWFKV